MTEMEILVAPNGVGVPEELQRTAPNLPMLLSLAGVTGGLVRGTLQVTEPVRIRIQVMRSDDVGLVWVAGPWVLHASDLRAGTLSQYCEIVRKSRAKAAMTARLQPPNVTVPRHVMSLFAADEGIPVGMIVQHTHDPPPVPLLDIGLDGATQTMWLVSVWCNIVARLGEPALRKAIAATEALRAEVNDVPSVLVERLPGVLSAHSLADDEAIACLVLDEWERGGGAAAIRAFTAQVAP